MADETLNANDGTLNVRAGSLGGTSMRYHELALQRWLNRLFFVREGYPVPVVFTSPMDAFSYFQQLWAGANNPFEYLFNMKDAQGTPLYEPHPSPVRYPIISAHRKGWKLRPYQNFSIHRWRHINWPTVANAGTERYGPQAQGWDLTKCNLGNVTTSRMPMAWDYRFQIDHFCNRPDTQAFFIEQLMQEFWRTGGTVPQTWISVLYPGWGNRRVRLYIDGDIENLTPEEPEDGKNVEFRTSFTVVVEGFDVDLRYEIYPALWNLVMRFGPVDPIQLEDCFNFTQTTDLRASGSNTTLDRRPDVPTWGTCQDIIKDIGAADQTMIEVVGINETANNQFGVFTVEALAVIPVSVYGTDAAGQSGSFVDGSYDFSPFGQNGSNTVSFVSGTLFDALALMAVASNGSSFVSFVGGTLYDVSAQVSSTGSQTVSFLSGSLADVTPPLFACGSIPSTIADLTWAVSGTNALLNGAMVGGSGTFSIRFVNPPDTNQLASVQFETDLCNPTGTPIAHSIFFPFDGSGNVVTVPFGVAHYCSFFVDIDGVTVDVEPIDLLAVNPPATNVTLNFSVAANHVSHIKIGVFMAAWPASSPTTFVEIHSMPNFTLT